MEYKKDKTVVAYYYNFDHKMILTGFFTHCSQH